MACAELQRTILAHQRDGYPGSLEPENNAALVAYKRLPAVAQYVEQRIQFPSPRLLDFLAARSLANRSAVLFFAAAADAFLARIERS
jgi:hypothetical protein